MDAFLMLPREYNELYALRFPLWIDRRRNEPWGLPLPGALKILLCFSSYTLWFTEAFCEIVNDMLGLADLGLDMEEFGSSRCIFKLSQRELYEQQVWDVTLGHLDGIGEVQLDLKTIFVIDRDNWPIWEKLVGRWSYLILIFIFIKFW